MRRIAIDTNIYTSFKCNDQSVVEALRDCDLIGVDITVIAELFSGFSLGDKEKKNRQEKLRQLKQQQPPPPPKEILIKKEAAAIGEFRSWSSCTVPLNVVANRESREARDRWSSKDLVLNRHQGGSGPKPAPAGVPSASLHRGTVSSTQVF